MPKGMLLYLNDIQYNGNCGCCGGEVVILNHNVVYLRDYWEYGILHHRMKLLNVRGICDSCGSTFIQYGLKCEKQILPDWMEWEMLGTLLEPRNN